MKEILTRDPVEEYYDQIAEKMAEGQAQELFDEAVIKNPALEKNRDEVIERFFEESFYTIRSHLDEHLKQLRAASEIIKQALEKQPLIQKEKLQSDFDKAIENVAKPLEERPLWKSLGISLDTLHWIMQLAQSEVEHGLLDEAGKIYYFLLIIDGMNPTLWFNYGQILKQQQKWEKAIECFTMSTMIAPTPQARYNAALCYLKLSSPEDAEIELTELENLLTTNALHQQWDPSINKLRQTIRR